MLIAEMVSMKEIDLDGQVDYNGVKYIGRAYRQSDSTWRCLADVDGRLCMVEVKISLRTT